MSTSDERKHLQDDNRNLPKLRRIDHIAIDGRQSNRPRSYASGDAGSRRHGEVQRREVNQGQSAQRPMLQETSFHGPRDGNHEQNTELRKSHHIAIDAGRRSAPRPYASTGNMRQIQTVTSRKGGDLCKSERSLAKQPQENCVPKAEEHHHSSIESASRKDLPLPRDPIQHVRRGSVRPNSQIAAQVPAAAALFHRFENTRQKAQTPATTLGTTTSRHGSKRDVDLAEKTNAVAQDGAASGIFGGIARVLGIRPPTAKEVLLEKDNHKLREEKKLLRTSYDNVEKAARQHHHHAFRFHHENLHLQETLEALSLKLKVMKMRYEEAKSLSETRLKRLLAAWVFVASEADSQSMSELIQKVESLNDDMPGTSNNAINSDAKTHLQDGADPYPNNKNATATRTPAGRVRTNALPEAVQGEDPRNRSQDSEVTYINPASQDDTGPASDMPGGIANAPIVRPSTEKEARLEKENRKLKEENKFLKTEYNNLQTATRKYHSEARRFQDENKCLQEMIGAMSLEVKDVTKKYEEVKSLSETRLKRLLAAQVFLTLEGAGSSSMSELIQKVDAMNISGR